jgi:hypothetical protein
MWQLHFAVVLPFIHPPTFTKIIRQTKPAPATSDFSAPTLDTSSNLPAASPEFLLAFLALTSRFHPTLSSYHSPNTSSRPSNPLLAAEYYATACKAKLARSEDSGKPPDLSRVQVYLMLALHEWGNCEGIKAWKFLGEALRCAQLIGLHLDLCDPGLKHSLVRPDEQLPGASAEDACIESETQRRILWSCYLLERCLSSGTFRPTVLRNGDIKIQLPSSERSFLFGQKVRTAFIADALVDVRSFLNGENNSGASSSPSLVNPESDTIWETGPNEGIVSRCIKASEVYNQVVKWACAGGRLSVCRASQCAR